MSGTFGRAASWGALFGLVALSSGPRALGASGLRIQDLTLPRGELPPTLRVAVEHGGQRKVLALRRESIRSERFQLLVQEASGALVAVDAPPPRTYRGTVEEEPGAVVAAALLPSGLSATVIPKEGSTWCVRPAGEGAQATGGGRPHAIFSEADLALPDLSHDALAPDDPRWPLEGCASGAALVYGGEGAAAGTCTLKAADLAIDTDYEFFSRVCGGDRDECLAVIEDGVNAINVPYIRDLKILHRLSAVIIRSDPAADFYARFPDASDFGSMLVAFRDEWNANMGPIGRDMAYYVTGKTNPEYGGLAYVGTTCTDYAYGMGLGYSGFAAILRHELGHNWGAGHDCGLERGYIMCGNSFDAFSGFNIETITRFRDSRGCLDEVERSSDPAPPYARPDFAQMVAGAGPVVIEALASDTDVNCDLLAISRPDERSAFGAEIRVIDGKLPLAQEAFLYLPRAGFSGVDAFRYAVADGTGFEVETVVLVNVVPRGLVAYWPLDEASGTKLSDASGRGHDGEVAGALDLAADSAAGKFSRAIQFRGREGDRVVVEHDPELDLRRGLTVSAWFTVDAFGGDGESIVAKGDSTWRLKRDGTNDALKFTCTGTTGTEARGTKRVADGLWHHAAGVYDGKAIYLYVDGALDASVASTGEIDAGSSSVALGGNRWNGKIDEVRIYNAGLSAEEIRALYDGGRAESPAPADLATGVNPGSRLAWIGAPGASRRDVYLGTDEAAVEAATPGAPEHRGTIAATSLAADLDPGTTYFWRVDEIVGPQVRKGAVWSFSSSIAFANFDEPPLGAPSYAPGPGGRELGFRTVSAPTDGRDPLAGVVETGSTPTSPIFSHRSVEATTTFDAVDLSGRADGLTAVSLELQARDTGYEAEDSLEVYLTGPGGRVDVLKLSGGLALTQFAGSGYRTARAAVPAAWDAARLVISSSSDSSQGSERYDFDNVSFHCYKPYRRIAYSLFEEPPLGASSYAPGPEAEELGFRTSSSATGGASPLAAVERSAGSSGGRFLSHRSVAATTTFQEVALAGERGVVVFALLRVRDTGYETQDQLELYATDGERRADLVRASGSGIGSLSSDGYRTFSAAIPADWSRAGVVFRTRSDSSAGSEQYDLRALEIVSTDARSPCDAPVQGPRFRRGDSNGDGRLDISDGIGILNGLFIGGADLACLDAADTDDSGGLDLTDGVRVFNHLFLGAEPPPEPLDCGEDPTEDTLGCGSYPACL